MKGLIALAFGALGFGVGEFVAMGLLPYFAHDFNLDIATAGHSISAYAFGVCFGIIYMVFTRKLNLKVSILIVVSCYTIGMVLTALAQSFGMVIVARFISGLPHGCFFGLGAIIAMRISAAGKGSSAMALMLAGQTTSIVCGVPLGTALAHSLSWRAIFILMAAWGVVVLVSLWRWLPNPGKLEDHGFWHQFHFLKDKAPYLVGCSIFLGNGGIFCMQSYVSPILTDFVGVPLGLVAPILIAMGISMTVYNLISGRLADKYTPGKVSFWIFVSCIAALLAAYVWGDTMVVGIVLLTYAAGCLFGCGGPQQVSILRTSPGGELIGVAFGQVAFNFGNAIGAFLGGVPLELGHGAESVLLVSAGLVFVGAGFMLAYILLSEKIFTERFFAAQKQRLEAAQQEAQAAAVQGEAERQAEHESEVAQVAAAQAEAKQ
ncbi:MAG: MFS transporter [Anaerobiospirillum sp.]|nr:MFS transporter [Anaerobiospirillum sp.]